MPVRRASGFSVARVPPWLHCDSPQGRHHQTQGPRRQAGRRAAPDHDGADLGKIHWVQGAMNTGGAHGSPTVLPLLKAVSVEQNRSNKSMSDLIEERAVDATLGTSLPEAVRTNP